MKYKILLILFSIGLLTSALIASGNTFGSICEGPKSGCAIVQSSEYASIFGFSIGYLGVLGFLLLTILTFIQLRSPSVKNRKLLSLFTTIAGFIALYFLFLQAFVLNAFCVYCTVVDLSAILALLISYFYRKE